MLKTNLAAGGVVALLFLSACGDDDAKENAQSQEPVAESAAQQVQIDPAQAPVIQKGIEDYLIAMEGPAEHRVLHHGTVKVTPGSGTFDVSIDGIRIGTQESDRLEIGTVTYRLAPKSDDGYIASDLVHAASFPQRNAAGEEIGSLTLVTKSFTGDWSSNLQTLLALDWQATDIVATDKATGDKASGGGDMRAASLTTSVTSTDKGNGIFDQTGVLNLTGLAAKDTTGGTLAMAKLAGTFGLSGVNLKDYVAKTREMQTLMAEIAEKAAANEAAAAASSDAEPVAAPPAMSPEQAKKLGDLVKSMSGLVGGVSYDFDVENVSFKEADGSEPFSLQRGGFELGMTGLDMEKASIAIGLSHDGLAIKHPDITGEPLFEKLLPAKGNLALNLTELPSKELWAVVGDQFPALAVGDQHQADAAFNILFLTLDDLLQKSSMKLTMAPSSLVSEVLQLGASGAFDIKQEAALGMIGGLDIDVHGLDAAMQLATEAAQTSAEAAQIVGSLAMIQSLAQRETDSDGKPVDKLKIEVDAMGDTKVNGVSLSGM